MGENFRTEFDENYIRDLAVNIKMVGQQEPCHGYYEDGFTILTRGENRLRAIQLTKDLYPDDPVTHIDILPCNKKVGSELALEQYIENNKRRPLSPVETARVFERMKSDGWSIDRISESTGESKSFISNHLCYVVTLDIFFKLSPINN